MELKEQLKQNFESYITPFEKVAQVQKAIEQVEEHLQALVELNEEYFNETLAYKEGAN